MNNKSLILLLSAALLFEGCSTDNLEKGQGVDDKNQSSLGWNGLGWNGLGWNGLGWNGLGWNGLGWNGLGWNGLGWNGLGWNGIGFNNTSVPTDWGLDTWINGSDADNDSVITSTDRELRLGALSYWISCACPSGTTLSWTGNNPYAGPPAPETRTFPGNFGLAPTWCTGTGAVPVEEQQAVSACIFARVNAKGIHNAVSLRGYDSSLQLADNEKLFMAYPEGQFFGNLWDTATEIYDPGDGNYYKNSTANACYYAWGGGNAQLAHDLALIVGRSCEWNGCGGPMKTTLGCAQDGSIDGSSSTGHDGIGNPITTLDPAIISSGANNSAGNGYPDSVTGQKYATWHNNNYRKISAYLGDYTDLEIENWQAPGSKCSRDCPAVDSCDCYGKYCRSENSSPGELGDPTCTYPGECNICSTMITPLVAGPVLGTSAACKDPAACVRGRKLTSLAAGYWLRLMFMRPFDLVSGAPVTGNANPHKAGSLLFRYSNGTGAAASIQIKDLIRNSMIPGSGFVPTAGSEDYQNNVIYPIYPGRSVFSDTTPGIDLAIAADPASPTFPHLDYVQMWVGPPYGVTPREQYDDGMTDKLPIPEDGKTFVRATVKLNSDGWKTDFAQAHMVRFRVVATNVKPSELRVDVIHGQSKVTVQGLDADGWSGWVENFYRDDPSSVAWTFQVYDQVANKSSGVLTGVALEMRQ